MIRLLAFVCIAVVVGGATADAAARQIWLDTDPACGLSWTDDVDDCWALTAALRSPRLKVVGISTVFGNASVDKTTKTARRLLRSLNDMSPGFAPPSLHRGAGEKIGAIIKTPPAVVKLAAALEERPLTILALGPLTNIASLISRRPDLANRITMIVAVAGQRPGQVFKVGTTPLLHFHDFNVRKDPQAMHIVLQSGVPLHLLPFEAGRQIIVTKGDLAALSANGPIERWLAEHSAKWLGFWRDVLGSPGFSPFDTLAVTYAADPRQFTCEVLPAKVIRRRGFFTVRDTLEVSHGFTDGRAVTYCSGLSQELRSETARLLMTD